MLELTEVPVQVFHGTDNSATLQAIAETTDRLTLTCLHTDRLSAPIYNALLLTPSFWERMIGRDKILIFQTDAILCANAPYGAEDFCDLAYIGARWTRHRGTGLILDGGEGGLTLRDWSASVDVLNNYPATLWKRGEDDYFGFHLAVAGYPVGRPKRCEQFATQSFFGAKSFGAHQVTWLPPKEAKAFAAYAPEAAFLFNQKKRSPQAAG